MLKTAEHTDTAKYRRLALASVLFWLLALLFFYIASEILERQPLLFDTAILRWIHAHSSHVLDTVLLLVTTLGNAEIIAPATVLFGAYLWYRKQSQAVSILFCCFFGAAAANFVLKLLFRRQRPDFWQSVLQESGYSFPSGHAMISSALAFALIAITWNTRWRLPVLLGGGVFMIAIGYSRLYLGVHYPTDILAGWLASLVWVMIVTVFVHRLPICRPKTRTKSAD